MAVEWRECCFFFFFFEVMVLMNLIFFRLDVYIYDYLLKRNLHDSAKAFMAEGKVSGDPVGKTMKQYVFSFF